MKQLTLIKIAGIVCSLAAFGVASSASAETLDQVNGTLYGVEAVQEELGYFQSEQNQTYVWFFKEVSEGVWERKRVTIGVQAPAVVFSNIDDKEIKNILNGDYGHVPNPEISNPTGITGIDATQGLVADVADNTAAIAALQALEFTNGYDGEDGIDGEDGLDGTDGVDGQNGYDGEDGIDGEDGLDGVDGQDGDDFDGDARLTSVEDLLHGEITTEYAGGYFGTTQADARWEFTEISEGLWKRVKFTMVGDAEIGVYYPNINSSKIQQIIEGSWGHEVDSNGLYFGNMEERADGLLANVEDNTGAIASNLAQINTNVDNINSISADLGLVEIGQIFNTQNIATNASDIATNSASIVSVTTEVMSNISDIAANAFSISDNTSHILDVEELTEDNYNNTLVNANHIMENGTIIEDHEVRINALEAFASEAEGAIIHLIDTVVNGEGGEGAQGIQGIQGAQGIQGEQGVAGTNGIDGTNGTDGADGAKGEKGEVGATGAAGRDGVDGTNGVDGLNGLDGADGIDGRDGVDGQDGRDGVDGVDGINGTNGVDGLNGLDGAKGADGIDGTDGVDGLNGLDGAKGDTGETGATGEAGKDGVTTIVAEEAAVSDLLARLKALETSLLEKEAALIISIEAADAHVEAAKAQASADEAKEKVKSITAELQTLEGQWKVDGALTRIGAAEVAHTAFVSTTEATLTSHGSSIEALDIQVMTNTADIAELKSKVASNTTLITENTTNITINAEAISALEVRVSNLENPTNNDDSAALKHLKALWVKAKQARAEDVASYYKTSKGFVIDLRGVDGYAVTQGLTVSQEYMELMGFESSFVGS